MRDSEPSIVKVQNLVVGATAFNYEQTSNFYCNVIGNCKDVSQSLTQFIRIGEYHVLDEKFTYSSAQCWDIVTIFIAMLLVIKKMFHNN
jgi:hypothetical protein